MSSIAQSRPNSIDKRDETLTTGILPKITHAFTSSSLGRFVARMAGDDQYFKVKSEVKKRAETIHHFSVELIPTFEHTTDETHGRIHNLHVSYPSRLLEDTISAEERVIFAHGPGAGYDDTERMFEKLFRPLWMMQFRPYLVGDLELSINNKQPLVLRERQLVTVHPDHLWSMVTDQTLNYQSGLHHDASFAKEGAETRYFIGARRERNGETVTVDSNLKYPTAEQLKATPEELEWIRSTFQPMQPKLIELAEKVLDLAYIKQLLREHARKQQPLLA